jgi:hypothetical protein
MSQTFRSTLQDNPPGLLVEVPPEVVAALNAGKRPAVRISVRDVELRTHIAVYGGKSYLGLRREIREAAGIAPGDKVEITLDLDTDPRSIDVPPHLRARLDADPAAQAAFDRLSFTNRKEYAQWIARARRAETRQKRLDQAPELLKRGVRTPLAGTARAR